TARLGEARDRQGAIPNGFTPATRKRGDFGLVEIHFPDLMMPGHRHKEIVTYQIKVPGAVECGLERGAAAPSVVALLSRSSDGLHDLTFKIHGPDQMVLPVRHKERSPCERHSLRIIKSCLRKWTVGMSRFAGADNRKFIAGQISDDDSMVGAVGDEQSFSRQVIENVARKTE